MKESILKLCLLLLLMPAFAQAQGGRNVEVEGSGSAYNAVGCSPYDKNLAAERARENADRLAEDRCASRQYQGVPKRISRFEVRERGVSQTECYFSAVARYRCEGNPLPTNDPQTLCERAGGSWACVSPGVCSCTGI